VERFLSPLSADHITERSRRLSDPPGGHVAEPKGKSYRTRGQRDRDRILYSSAFQRLAYVTQVTAPESGHTFHNRLSHSLKVAQVGRRNAERLIHLAKEGEITGAAAELVLGPDDDHPGLDPDAVEASCLAHDLGHPPYGHIAEEALHECAIKHIDDGFEGNAQSFRIVTHLAVRVPAPGLDLTRRTLDGLLKYPWRYQPKDQAPGQKRERKWGYYMSDHEAFAFAREFWPEENDDALPERCLEAEIMEWADDLTYAVHDVDDFYRADLIPLHRLADEKSAERRRLAELLTEFKEDDPAAFPSDYTVDELVGAAGEAVSAPGPIEAYRHSINGRATMRAFGSQLITDYLEAFKLSDEGGKPKLTIGAKEKREVTALTLLVRVFVIRRPGLAVVQHGQRRMIEDLFAIYLKAASPEKKVGDRRLFPPSAREALNATQDPPSRARVVVDFLSGLTEEAVVQLHRRLCGGWSAPTLDATAQIG
jgi:dGTPase